MAEASYLNPGYREKSMFDLIGTQPVASDSPSYIEDPVDILSQIWSEQSNRLQPAIEATQIRASATIGPKETGPIEDIVGGFYASNRLAPVMAGLDDVFPGIPFYNIIPDPPAEFPDESSNRMRNAIFGASLGPTAGGLATGVMKTIDKASDIYRMVKSGDIKPIQDAKWLLAQKGRKWQSNLNFAAHNPKEAVRRLLNTYEGWEKKNLRLGETWRAGHYDEAMAAEKGWQYIPGQKFPPKDPLITKLTPRGVKAKDDAINELYGTLNTRKEWNKFKTTYDDIIHPAQYDDYNVHVPRTFNQYKSWLKRNLLEGSGRADELKLSPGSTLMDIGESGAVGRFRHKGKEIAMSTYLSKGDFKSIFKHELKHSLDFAVDQYRSTSYKKLEDAYEVASSGPVFQALGQHRLRSSIALKKYKEANPMWEKTGVPHDLIPVNPSLERSTYLLKPTEVSARITEIKSPGGLDKLRNLLNIKTRPESDLLEVFDQSVVDKLKKTVWGAVPMLMDDEDVYKSLK